MVKRTLRKGGVGLAFDRLVLFVYFLNYKTMNANATDQINVEQNSSAQLVVGYRPSRWGRLGENCLILFGSILAAPVVLIVACSIIGSPVFWILFGIEAITDYLKAKAPTNWQKFLFYFVVLVVCVLVLLVVLSGVASLLRAAD